MILSQEDRDKFVAWLELDISSTESLLRVMAQTPSLLVDSMAKQMATEVVASEIVVKKLRSFRSETIGGVG